jgi:hypothetical protein
VLLNQKWGTVPGEFTVKYIYVCIDPSEIRALQSDGGFGRERRRFAETKKNAAAYILQTLT